MSFKGTVCLVFLVLICMATKAFSQSEDQDTVEYVPYKNNILPTPSFTYQPATDIVIGAYLLYQFKPKKAGPETRASNAQLWVAASLNNQTFLRLSHENLTPGEKLYLTGKIDTRFNPEYYYGIGNEAKEEDQVIVEYDYFQVEERILVGIRKNIFGGGQIKYNWTSPMVFKSTKGDTLEHPDIPGTKGVQYIGLGGTFLRDKRNRILTPTENSYLEVAADAYFGDVTFGKVKFDYRRYWRIKNDEKKVLAFQYLLDWGFGEVPFREYSKMGGARIMRGYLEGRYRDLIASQVQAEFRWNMVGRFGMTFFGGFGNVLPNLDPEPDDLKAAVGAGLRFNVNRKDPANIRIDYGFSVTDRIQALYITFGEAF